MIADPFYAVAIVSFLLVSVGLYVIKNLKPESPLVPYVLQILGLTFILPVVLLMSVTLKLENEAVIGILGTIVGYIFGTSKLSESKSKAEGVRRKEEAPEQATDNKEESV